MQFALGINLSNVAFSRRAGKSISPQATAFLTRANAVATLDATHTTAYTALINGLVSDGVWPKLDALYVFATQSSGHALLNLVSSSYTATLIGAPTFQADHGFTGVGTTTGIDSTFNPTTASSPKFAQNSAHLSVWSNSIGVENFGLVFADTTGSTSTIYPDFNTPGTYMRLNDASASGVISTATDGSGFYVASRDSSTVRTGYWNGASLGTSPSAASTAPPNATVKFLGPQNSNTSKKQISMGSIGGALTATDVANLYARLQIYLAAVFSISPLITIGVASATGKQALVLQTTDGAHFVQAPGVTNPVYSFPAGGGAGSTSFTVGGNLMFSRGKYWMCFEMNDLSGTQKTFGIAKASSLNGPWTWVTDVTVLTSGSNTYVWNPHWFVDDDGSVHIYGYYGANGGNQAVTPFMVDCLDTTTYASWSAPVNITGSSSAFPNSFGDFFILSPNNNPTGLYALWTRNLTTGFFDLNTSSSRSSGYALAAAHPIGEQGPNIFEGITPVKIAPGIWRFYYYPIGINHGWQFSDSFDNWATFQPIQNTSLFSDNIITTGPMIIGPA